MYVPRAKRSLGAVGLKKLEKDSPEERSEDTSPTDGTPSTPSPDNQQEVLAIDELRIESEVGDIRRTSSVSPPDTGGRIPSGEEARKAGHHPPRNPNYPPGYVQATFGYQRPPPPQPQVRTYGTLNARV